MFIDISYPLKTDMAIYPNNPSFSIEKVTDIERGDSSTVSRIIMGSHTGTHIDAPAHFIKGGMTIDQIPLERMNGPAKVLDVTGNSDITPEILERFDIVESDIILLKTDNSICWSCDCILDEYVTLTYEAADYIAERKIKLVGIDYLTIELSHSKRKLNQSIHNILLGANILVCEGLNLSNVDEGNYAFICMPLDIRGGDGCPVRGVLKL